MNKYHKEKLLEISLKSSESKTGDVFIYEKGSMLDFIDKKDAEKIRNNFLKNGIKVKQITNNSTLLKFTKNTIFLNKVMQFRYVSENIFTIKDEILIFDDTVAIYNDEKIDIIKHHNFAQNQKELFLNTWDLGESPKLNFDYKPNHSFYNNLNFTLKTCK